LRYSNRAVCYSSKVQRVVKEAVYGKFMEQITAEFGGDDFFLSSNRKLQSPACSTLPTENNFLYLWLLLITYYGIDMPEDAKTLII